MFKSHFLYSSILEASVAVALLVLHYSLFANSISLQNLILQTYLVFSGVFFIYNIDRIRDLKHDRITKPLRSVYIEANLKKLLTFSFILQVPNFYILLQLRSQQILFILVAFGITSIQLILLRNSNSKIANFSKPVALSSVWLVVTYLLPINQFQNSAESCIYGLAVFLVFLFNSILYDLNDVKYDSENRRPNSLKFRSYGSSIKILSIIWLLSLILFVISSHILIWSVTLLFYLAILIRVYLLAFRANVLATSVTKKLDEIKIKGWWDIIFISPIITYYTLKLYG